MLLSLIDQLHNYLSTLNIVNSLDSMITFVENKTFGINYISKTNKTEFKKKKLNNRKNNLRQLLI